MRRPVLRAQLINPVDLKGFTPKNTLSKADLKGGQMYFDGLVLEVHYSGEVAGIPASNLKGVVYDAFSESKSE